MKSTIKKFLPLFLVALLLTSCNVNIFNRINGNKNVITEDRSSKDDFTKIKVSTGLDLYITQGSRNKITVEADENLHDIIITEVKNGVLKVYSEKNIWRAEARKVHVTIKNLERISATSGADVYTKDILNVDNIQVNATSGADIRISLNANSIDSNATSGSDIRLSGNANNHNARATSGASVHAYGLESKSASAKVTSGADIDIYASESINAVATSGGDVDVKGKPEKVSKTSNSGGSISIK